MLKEMASYPSFFSSFNILISLLLMITYTSHSSSEFNNISHGRHPHHHLHLNQKVNLTLYYETLCPACQNFILNGLAKVFKTDLQSIVNLHLVPFGNAHIKGPNKTVICQHGPLECYYNTIEACALHVWPLEDTFPFIYCVETRLQERDKTVWETCCKDLNLDPKYIRNCHKSGLGKQLILQNAEETGGLKPPHQYVPWVTVNDKTIFLDYDNFIKYICDAYKGHPKPRACKLGYTVSSQATHSACHANLEWRSP